MMKTSIILVAVICLSLAVFPTTTVGKNQRYLPKPSRGWPHPWGISRNNHMVLNKINYGGSKVWHCTYNNGSAPSISISPSNPATPSPSTPQTSPPPPTPSLPPPTPKTSPPPPPTPSLPPPTPKTSPPPPTPSLPPPTPKTSPPPPPTPSLPPPTPKTSPPPPAPTLPPPTPKTSPPPPTPSLPPPTPKKSPSPPPSNDGPSNPPPPENHESQREKCWGNIGRIRVCQGQVWRSHYWRSFYVSDDCCNLIAGLAHECDDVVWGLGDPYFVSLVRCTCHVQY